jgi:hypothetical protein
MGSLPSSVGKVDLYTLNPGSVVKVYRMDNEALKKVSFTYVGGLNIEPCIE